MILPVILAVQVPVKLLPNEFNQLSGCWTGTLRYLDYTSNKTVDMKTEFKAESCKQLKMPCYVSYPDEPMANSFDTIYFSKDGKTINNEKIISKLILGKDSIRVVTEFASKDGNQRKDALIRNTYELSKTYYAMRKEVKFAGTDEWFERNSFRYSKVGACN